MSVIKKTQPILDRMVRDNGADKHQTSINQRTPIFFVGEAFAPLDIML